MAGTSVVINSAGISAPTYADILASIQASYKTIYGSDIYVGADSQDGQFLALIALAIKSENDAVIDAYNSFSPSTAQGVGLSSVVKINGLRRLVPTASTVNVTLVGVAGTVILNGIVSDDNNSFNWNLPSSVTIPVSGTITVLATCTTLGAIPANPSIITKIVTPTVGWQTVTNVGSATQGLPTESDAALRVRQAKSTAIPALSILNGIYGGVANIAGVTRVATYENASSIVDSNGLPAHSISVVVEGGTPLAIATQIAIRKTPGTGTYGNISQIIYDVNGVPSTINYYALTTVTLSVVVFMKALTAYASPTSNKLIAALVNFISTQSIGQQAYLSRLWAPSTLSGQAATLTSSLLQAQLDVFSKTYEVTALAQARSNMTVTGGPYTGVAVINVTSIANYTVGETIYFILDDASWWSARITTIIGTTITFTPAIPVARTLANGALVYVVGDVIIAFTEATTAATAQITTVVS